MRRVSTEPWDLEIRYGIISVAQNYRRCCLFKFLSLIACLAGAPLCMGQYSEIQYAKFLLYSNQIKHSHIQYLSKLKSGVYLLSGQFHP